MIGVLDVNFDIRVNTIHTKGLLQPTPVSNLGEVIRAAQGVLPYVKNPIARKSNKIIRAFCWEHGHRTCGICHQKILYLGDYTIDHIIPLSRGGSNALFNLQPAHMKCNEEKRHIVNSPIDKKTSLEFLEQKSAKIKRMARMRVGKSTPHFDFIDKLDTLAAKNNIELTCISFGHYQLSSCNGPLVQLFTNNFTVLTERMKNYLRVSEPLDVIRIAKGSIN